MAACKARLTSDKVYEVSIFHAERHTGASNFRLTLDGFVTEISTCDYTCGDGIATRFEFCDDGAAQNTGAYGHCMPDCYGARPALRRWQRRRRLRGMRRRRQPRRAQRLQPRLHGGPELRRWRPTAGARRRLRRRSRQWSPQAPPAARPAKSSSSGAGIGARSGPSRARFLDRTTTGWDER